MPKEVAGCLVHVVVLYVTTPATKEKSGRRLIDISNAHHL
jgi:hypothetical protein